MPFIEYRESENCSVMSDSLQLHGPWDSPGQNSGVGSLSLLQGIFPIQGSNSGLLHCRWIVYQLSHTGSPRIREWVAYPFSSGSSRPGNRTGVSCLAGGFFTNWAIREALTEYIIPQFKKNLKERGTEQVLSLWLNFHKLSSPDLFSSLSPKSNQNADFLHHKLVLCVFKLYINWTLVYWFFCFCFFYWTLYL